MRIFPTQLNVLLYVYRTVYFKYILDSCKVAIRVWLILAYI